MNDRKVKLTLYIADRSARSSEAIERLQQAFKRNVRRNFALELVSVSEAPMRALRERVLITPTLIADGRPGRVVGDLSDPVLLDYFLESVED